MGIVIIMSLFSGFGIKLKIPADFDWSGAAFGSVARSFPR
jgi:drug/metabolite transporter superfamily protein YnfA